MRRRNKRMAGLALAVMMAMGSLAACGGQKDAPAPAAPAAADTRRIKLKKVRLRILPARQQVKPWNCPGMWVSLKVMRGARFPMILQRRLKKKPMALLKSRFIPGPR